MEELLLDKLNGIFLTHELSIKSQNLHKVNMNDSCIHNKVTIPAMYTSHTTVFSKISKMSRQKNSEGVFHYSQILRTFH